MGTLIMIFLFLMGFAFVAGFYLGQKQNVPPAKTSRLAQKKTAIVEEKPAKTKTKVEPIVPRPVPEPAKTSKKAEKMAKPAPIKSTPQKGSPSSTQPYYTLQVAALKNKSSAIKLADSLRRNGYNVTLKTEGGLYKIRVGKFFSYDRANSERKKLVPLLKKLRVRIRNPREIIIRKILR